MARPARPLYALATAALAVAVGCGDEPHAPAPWLLDPALPMPRWLGEAGIYTDLIDLDPAPGFVTYTPPHPLFSNRAEKARLLWLPAGAAIDTHDPERWAFPVGTVLVKTFTYRHVEGRYGEVAIETRVIRHAADGWQYAVYHHGARGDEGRLEDPGWPERAFLLEDVNGSAFPYVIPGELDCEACHETDRSPPVIGLGRDNLDPALIGPDAPPIFDPIPVPSTPPARTNAEEKAMSYLVGNCVHCHHGEPGGDNASFDLRPEALVQNTVGVPTDSSASGDGIRVVPGVPEGSALFEAVVEAREPGYRGAFKPMPPVGLVQSDRAAADILRRWIEELAR